MTKSNAVSSLSKVYFQGQSSFCVTRSLSCGWLLIVGTSLWVSLCILPVRALLVMYIQSLKSLDQRLMKWMSGKTWCYYWEVFMCVFSLFLSLSLFFCFLFFPLLSLSPFLSLPPSLPSSLPLRVSHFSVANRSHELLLQPVNREGARSITGEYQCHVSARNNPSHYIDRSIYIQVNGECII